MTARNEIEVIEANITYLNNSQLCYLHSPENVITHL